ncbi:TetR/AcrR family transcriptional regulator [Sporolactobacillus sp. CPB3-1]|uniref:TetR/AcrR family transcriptional regulator n=1 Tax=Sporolactobacillus mangiferae TaxID=2940498 RepID=A0ABT0MDM5_9BACL|nr:TetR/AcrR family transcriptional regulator [Sporolactobacillus mangiferae]MCL1632969.1 TetR/AcrR family transcriptional regulator [Sporolactobacillus mangiferae]
MITEHERKQEMINKINDDIVKNGFKALTMDGIAKVMGISRGKLYQYFSSKDEVIEAVTARYIQYIEKISMIADPKDAQGFIDEFLSIYFQNVVLAGSSSETFINDLKTVYPDLYEKFSESLAKRDAVIQNFYESGMRKGVFNPGLNAQLLHFQDKTMLTVLVLPKFLFTHRLEPSQALRDYLKIRVRGIIIPEYQSLVNDANVNSQIQHLDKKFRRVFTETI